MQKPLLNRLLTDGIMGLKTNECLGWFFLSGCSVVIPHFKFLRKENL